MKRLNLAIGALVVPGMLFSLGLAYAQDKTPYNRTEIKIASAYDEESIVVKVARKFKEIIERRTEGVVKVNVLPGGSVGNSEAINEAVTLQAIQMAATDAMLIYMYTPEYFFCEAPYIMKDSDHYFRFWNSALGDKMRQKVLDKGKIQIFKPFYRGSRIFMSKKVPIRSPEDFKGLKLRIPVIDTWVTLFKQLGAEPVPIPLNDLYMSLSTGVVSATEGPADQLWSFALYEVQEYLSLTNHLPTMGLLTINQDFLRKQNENTQKVIWSATQEAAEWGSDLSKKRETELIDKMVKEKGMKLVIPVDKSVFAAKIRDKIDELFKTKWNVTTYADLSKL
jgi:tripartite ATP-independent transporter DctP family solute receptor